MFASGNWSSTRPNGVTTPFGGLMSHPELRPIMTAKMYYLGVR